jgi:3-oxoacyl-[acyl-carrier-protein] synthase-3
MRTIFNNLKISGIASSIPDNKLSLLDYKGEFGEKEIARIIASTGIESVNIVPKNMKASDLCLSASYRLLETLNISADTVDAIIFVSQTPDYKMPATSCVLQNKLGMKKSSVAFDINYGCSGYIYGLYQAAMLLSAGGCERVLLCTGDTISRHLDPKDRKVRLVFGDAGNATLIEQGEHDMAISIMTDGAGFNDLIIDKTDDNCDDFLHMDGSAIMQFALREVPAIVEDTIAMMNWKKAELDLAVLHQANQFMLNYLRKKMKLREEIVPIAVKNYGNTGPSSIPLTLSHFADDFSKKRLEKVIMSGFGVGLSWGAVAVNLSHTQLIKPTAIVNNNPVP